MEAKVNFLKVVVIPFLNNIWEHFGPGLYLSRWPVLMYFLEIINMKG
jgi:hypothetical protein